MRYHVETDASRPLCARCAMHWPCTDSETEDRVEELEADLARLTRASDAAVTAFTAWALRPSNETVMAMKDAMITLRDAAPAPSRSGGEG